MTTNEIDMHVDHAYGNLPAWVWKAIANTTRDAKDAIPVTILRTGKPAYPDPGGLVVIDLDDWQAIRRILEREP